MGWATALTSLISAGASSAAASKGYDAADKAAQQKLKEYMKVKMPTLSEQEIELLAPQLMGQLTPEAEQAIGLGPSKMEEVTTDQALRDAQTESLDQLSEIAEGGLSEGDLAAARQIQRQGDQANQARQKAILQNMQMRGVGGSGMELAARLGAKQETAQSQAEAQDELIRQAQQRALQAMTQRGSMAGNVRGQDFSEQSAKARAADEIARTNMMNQQGVQQRNISARNQAQMANLQARQQLENQRIEQKNKQEMYNKALKDKVYQQQLDMADRKSGVYGDQAKAAGDAARGEAAAIGTIGSGLVDAFSSKKKK